MEVRAVGAGSRDPIEGRAGWKGFLAAVVAVVVATALRWALDPYMGDEIPFVTYFLAIIVAAWYGRLWPGVVATILSVLAAHWLFVSPRRSLAVTGIQPHDIVELSVFVLVGLALAGLSEALHRGRIEAQARARESAAATATARAQKEVLRVTIASIGDAVVTTDSDARVTSMNAAAGTLTGWSSNDALGRPVDEVLELVEEGSRVRIHDPCGRAIDSGRTVELPSRTMLISRDGRERPIEDSAAPIRDESGKTLGCVLVFRDVTEQRRVQESLEHLASIVSHSGDAIVAKRLDGTITSWNGAAERLYGLSADEAIGRPISSIVPDERSEELSLIMERLRHGEHIDRLETVRIRSDGTLVDVAVTISPLEDPFGTVIGASAITRDISERKRSEEALRRREQELADFFQNSVVGLHRLDADGVILDANQAELDMLGYARSEYVGRRLVEFHLDEQVIDELLADLRRGEPVRGREGRMRCKDGAIKHVLIDANSYVENGEFKHSRGFTRDVTAERRALEALRMSEERLRLAMGAGSIGVWGWDAVSGRLQWTDHVHRIHGVSPDDFGGTVEDFRRLIHPGDAARVVETFQMALDGDSPFTTEFRILRPSGEMRWVQTSADVMRDEGGRPLRIVGATIDTTERKAAEQSARFLADASEAVTALDDPERAMRRLARACVPFFADWCTIHLGEEQGAAHLVACVHADGEKESLVASLESDRSFEWGPASPGTEDDVGGWYMRDAPPDLIDSMASDDHQLELLRRLEPRSWIAVPLRSRGRTLGSIAFVRSESGRRYGPVEKEVALEVVDRAATSVDNCMLYEEVVKAGRQKDDFLAMLGHELRNPLAAIQYSVALAKTLPERAAWANDTIRRQVDHLARLVDDLLDVSRITRNVIELKTETIDVNDVVKRAVGTSRPAIDQQEHRLALRTPDPELMVSADPTRIEQVVVNLLTNAAKYTPKGGQITLSAFADGDDAVIKVEDSGIGIPADLLPHVFGLFTQAETELSRPQGGLGIGLTVVHRLIELHGGSVSAASGGVGQGSQFIVRLPLLEGARPLVQAPEQEEAIRSGMRILVVDDNQDTADSVGMLLESAGFTTRVAYDGLAALDEAEAFRPEVVLLDIGLPGLDGYQVAERLRGDPRADGIKLIAISGYGQASDRQRSEEAGFDRHLVKPIDFEGLLDEMKELAREQA